MLLLSETDLKIKEQLVQSLGWKEQDAVNFIQQCHKEQTDVIEKLIRKNLFTSQKIVDFISSKNNIKIAELTKNNIDKKLNEQHIDMCKRHNVVFLKSDSDQFQLAVANPEKKEMLSELNYYLKGNFELFIAKYSSIRKNLDYFNDLFHQRTTETLLNTQNQQEEVVDLSDSSYDVFEEHENVVNVNNLLNDAIEKGASDIHLEPKNNSYIIRYRVDGKMFQVEKRDRDTMRGIIARIKVIASLDITERRQPQEGRFTTTVNKEKVDFRVSILPLVNGEKLVIRVLDNLYSNIGIHKIGMTESQRSSYLNALQKKQGMILVTGPTGAGKTITLFSGISELPCNDINVITAESPVEVQLPQINQTDIDEKKGITYPNVLRYILRQDPDVIMVGEIRDTETLEISFKAAQTGHLVLSTLHSKTPFQTFERLETMSESLFNIVNSINLICSQRLFRKLCPNCRQAKSVTKGFADEMAKQDIDLKEGETYFKANENGCDECHDGHLGRTAIFEVLEVDDEIREALLDKRPMMEIKKIAASKGHQQLKDVALEQVKDGTISIDEYYSNIF